MEITMISRVYYYIQFVPILSNAGRYHGSLFPVALNGWPRYFVYWNRRPVTSIQLVIQVVLCSFFRNFFLALRDLRVDINYCNARLLDFINDSIFIYITRELYFTTQYIYFIFFFCMPYRSFIFANVSRILRHPCPYYC